MSIDIWNDTSETWGADLEAVYLQKEYGNKIILISGSMEYYV